MGVDDEEIVRGWVRYAVDRRDEDFASWDHVTTLVLDQPEQAWPILLQLIAEAPEDQLGYIGGGPLETFISEHVAAFGQRIEDQARRDRRFRAALASAWLSEAEVPGALITRLHQLTRGSIQVRS